MNFYTINAPGTNILTTRGRVSQTADLVKSLDKGEYFIVPNEHVNIYKSGNSLYSKVNKLKNRTLTNRTFKVYQALDGWCVKRTN